MNHNLLSDIINQIHNADIRKFTIECLKDAPDEIDTIPASKSGKYHPPEATAEGGLIWHIQRACWFANLFMISYKWKDDDIRGDIVISALLLHDLGKRAEYAKYWDYVDHPKTAMKMITRFKNLIPEKVFRMIANCVLHHMGPFGGKFFMKPIKDYNLLEILVYNADYMSSRKDLKIE